MKLSIGKLSRILQKEHKKLVDSGYFKDLYNDRAFLGTLTIIVNGEDINFDIRSFRFNPKRYKLTIFGVNWTHHAGYCSIDINTQNIKSMIYRR